MLCSDCDSTRHQEWLASYRDKSVTVVASSAASSSATSTSMKNAKTSDLKASQSRTTDITKLSSKEVIAVCAVQSESVHIVTKIVCNDLLAYVHCYRDNSNADALRRVVLNCFSSEDISSAKKLLCCEFQSVLASNMLLTERRSSASRPAHEAELDDIVGIFDALDAQNALRGYMFTVLNLLNVPKYGPEETNINVVVDRQVKTEASIAKLAENFDQLKFEMVDTSAKHTAEALNSLNDKLDHLSNAVAEFSRADGVVPKSMKPATEHNRSMNLIMFGIAEDRDANVWRRKVDDTLSYVTGRAVDVVDMFRLGGKFDSSKVRPVLVKLRTVWDRRIILGQCYKLRQCADQIYIAPDEPLDVRRKRILDRKKAAAVRDGKAVEVINNVLVVDNVEVYSLKDGVIARSDG